MNTARKILLACTIIWLTALAVLYWQYVSWCNQKLQEYPEAVRPYVDFTPFPETPIGTGLIISGVCIIISWVLLLKKSGTLNYFVIAIFIYVLIMTTAFSIARVLATEVITINVMLVWDEEVQADSWLQFVANDAVHMMCDVYRTFYKGYAGYDFSIVFQCTNWFVWDSSDNQLDPYYLLQEAITEMNWYWGKIVDGKQMHLMVVASGQPLSYKGLSPPDWKALIFKVDRDSCAETEYTLMHEMGHQFNCDHCSIPFCAMNVGSPFAPIDYCAWHTGKIYQNRYLPLTPPPSQTPSPSPSPSPSPTPRRRGGGAGRWVLMC